jgi:hypothetical protein
MIKFTLKLILKLAFGWLKGLFTPRHELSGRINHNTGKKELYYKPMERNIFASILGVAFFSTMSYLCLVLYNNYFSVSKTNSPVEVVQKESKPSKDKPIKRAKRFGDEGLYIQIGNENYGEVAQEYKDNTNTTKINLNKGGQQSNN